jgi:hypothetical protein
MCQYCFYVTPTVLLPAFQKGRDIKASQGKGQGAALAKKGNLRRTRKNFNKRPKGLALS